MPIGEPYWRRTLPELIEQFQDLGYDVVERMLADRDSWDRYTAAQWLNTRRRLDQNPADELAPRYACQGTGTMPPSTRRSIPLM